MRTIVVLAALVAVALAQSPPDLPCVTWIPLTSDQQTPINELFIAAYTWVIGYGVDDCVEMGDVVPCWAADSGTLTWGHHDYQPDDIPNDVCRVWVDGQVQFSNTMYVPKKGPQYKTWTWQLAQTGGTIPDNAIRFGNKIMARNSNPPPGYCFGKGFIGWAEDAGDNTFGQVHFSIVQDPVTMTSFEVAICTAYHPTTPAPTPVPTTTAAPPTPKPATPAPPTPVPTTPEPTPSPTLPPNNKPYIRFGNTIASPNLVTATITQPNATYTWSNYGFAQFSGWIETFAIGTGTIQIYDASNGSSQLLLTTTILLTPGPLVVVVKDYWPPKVASNVETIAASYVPPKGPDTGVRLFNLSPDTAAAGMSTGGTTLVNNIKYSIGSVWAPVPVAEATFTAFDSSSNAVLATTTFMPPPVPFVFSNFLLGLQNSTLPQYKTRAVPLIDAPEQ